MIIRSTGSLHVSSIIALVAAATAAIACSGTPGNVCTTNAVDASASDCTGGSSSTGGAAATGGSAATTGGNAAATGGSSAATGGDSATGGAATGGAATGGNQATGGSSSPGCVNPAVDCPTPANECSSYVCASQQCSLVIATGTAANQQTAGDCKRNECNSSGAIVSVNDDADLPVDNNSCTQDVCNAGVASNPPMVATTPCTGGLCDGNGQCVGCLQNSDCAGATTECQSPLCTSGTCSTKYTDVGTATSNQTAGDCKKNQCGASGVIESVADDADVPVDNKQCTDDVCTAGVASNPPKAADTDCTEGTGHVCDGAGTCGPYNIAGNGNVEYGTTAGYTQSGSCPPAVSNTTASGYSHAGQYSLACATRTHSYDTPSYVLPTGPGQYKITAWGMQNQDATFAGSLQIALACQTGATTSNLYPSAQYNISMAQSVWTKFTGTVDTSTGTGSAACLAATPGTAKTATLYLGQVTAAPTPVTFPDLFWDDVVVQVTDGHNLIGVSNFETAGVTNGWSNNGGGTLAINTTIWHGPATSGGSLALTTRTSPSNAPKYALPIGKAKYNMSVWVMHTGTTARDIWLAGSYTCLGLSTQYPTFATASAVPPNTWTQISASNVAMPPANATAGCRLTAASMYVQQAYAASCAAAGECPDIYIDDASLTVVP